MFQKSVFHGVTWPAFLTVSTVLELLHRGWAVLREKSSTGPKWVLKEFLSKPIFESYLQWNRFTEVFIADALACHKRTSTDVYCDIIYTCIWQQSRYFEHFLTYTCFVYKRSIVVVLRVKSYWFIRSLSIRYSG